jgi:hypothetical protein
VGFLAVCLLVSLAWVTPGAGHRLVDACCAYRGWRPGPGATVRLVMGAFLLRQWYEIVWTVAATVLVTAPFEAWVGSGRMLATVTLGHLAATVTVTAAGLAHDQRLGGGGLDVGASPLATAEHLTAIVVGALATVALSRLPPGHRGGGGQGLTGVWWVKCSTRRWA